MKKAILLIAIFIFLIIGLFACKTDGVISDESMQSDASSSPKTEESSGLIDESSEAEKPLWEKYEEIRTFNNGKLYVLRNDDTPAKYALVNNKNDILLDFECNTIIPSYDLVYAEKEDGISAFLTVDGDFIISFNDNIEAHYNGEFFIASEKPLDGNKEYFLLEKDGSKYKTDLVFSDYFIYENGKMNLTYNINTGNGFKYEYYMASNDEITDKIILEKYDKYGLIVKNHEKLCDTIDNLMIAVKNDNDDVIKELLTDEFYKNQTNLKHYSKYFVDKLNLNIESNWGYIYYYTNFDKNGLVAMRFYKDDINEIHTPPEWFVNFIPYGNESFKIDSFVLTEDA
ncbi:hypothetical protein LJB90_02555 [Eubacteriales bacterium OttesenSCG-928-G02]|nr:hypothetical protein [Eubacteriales bacterium OttesenSCG-928-G02]